jgi:PIN domain nuclease of toxin-antitoxin system
MQRFLLDTHTVIWLLEDESLIPATTLDLLKFQANPLMVSIASFWEMAIKVSVGKLNLAQPIDAMEAAMRQQGVAVLPVTMPHLLGVQTLPFHHRDPFDRLLIAQAMTENLTLISRDPKFAPYPINILW